MLGLSFEGGIFDEQQMRLVPMVGKNRHGHNARNGGTHPSFLGAKENAHNELSIFGINTWGDQFSKPL